ncbi:hypothetical protein [Clavibacter capsici]|uniref:hypothetical protein n=1 Tax=Clavibacter capsici TaxID=1874630 RepID=UPI00142813EF|nr:hypothetical protein [Clavibacter capsici]QIS38655.1 hypothetical protein GW572_04580 [Clavibacter capsici]
MTLTEAAEVMAKPEYANRTRIDVYEDGDEYTTTYEGVEYRWSNPFGLDSILTDAGVPAPRNLFLIEAE